ncbi:MAG: Rad52/Rad22 family DNA repair protein [Gemmataceae bacterium]
MVKKTAPKLNKTNMTNTTPTEETRTTTQDIRKIREALAEPFEEMELHHKPQTLSKDGNRALAITYVDARVIQDRLDQVLGVENWQDSYKVLEDGTVVCRLRLKLGDAWVTKVDVGSPSVQGDEGDRRKAAFSDALKRAAVKFGVGRYLYRLPIQWVPYDSQKKVLREKPKLPLWARPKPKEKEESPATLKVTSPPEQAAPKPKKEEKPTPAKNSVPGKAMPKNGMELRTRLYNYDSELAKRGLCTVGALVKHVMQKGAAAGYPDNLDEWSGDAIQLAITVTKEFEAHANKRDEVDHRQVA